jgi:PBSX family phage portal protein
VMAQSAIELEDEFSSDYYTVSNQSKSFLAPPFDPTVLLTFANTNNILKQCIEAMEVNIDGTGFSFVAVDEQQKPNEEELARADAFFGEPYPNESFTKIRRKLRNSLESVGYGYLEVLRNVGGEVVAVRNVQTHNVRFVKLDAPVLVNKTISRNGKDIELTLWERERRFVQRAALTELVYYREYGSTREVDRITGEWETPANPIPPERRGTELMVFGVSADVTTPYFVPRWINELPSVVGSRKAEEQNLQFLDSGGMPPAIIFVQGGTLAKDMSDQLKMYLSGQNKNKYRAVVVEAQSSSGSLDSAGNVQVKVERFGAQAAQDAMFMKYDESTEEHIRKGFRLPPLFIGKSQDQNFATAVTSYLVAEAQVFAPERNAFDEYINKTLVKELGFKTIKLKSNPITIADIASQLKGLELSKDMATRDSFLKAVNIATGMSLALAPLPQPDTVMATVGAPGETPRVESTVPDGTQTVAQTPHEQLPASTRPPAANPTHKVVQLPQRSTTERVPTQNKRVTKTASEIVDLAQDFAAIRGLTQKRELTPERVQLVQQQVLVLEPEDRRAFDALLASYIFGVEAADDSDLVELAGYAR